MRSPLHKSTLLLGAFLLVFSQSEVHTLAHAHEVRNFKGSFNLRDKSYHEEKGEHKGNSDWNGGNYEYKEFGAQDGRDRDGEEDRSTITWITTETEEWTAGMSATAATGEYETTTTETIELSTTVATASVAMSDTQQGGQVAAQLSFVTTTIFETGPAQTITVTPMPQVVTQTQMVTVTEPGTCSTTGLIYQTPVSDTSATDAVSIAAQATTSAIATSSTSTGSPPVGSSGQVVQGNGVFNAAGACDCECRCAAGSFPSYGAMDTSPAAAAPTTMQTVVSYAGTQNPMSASMLSTGSGSTVSAQTAASYTTMSPSSSDATGPSNPVFTLNPSISSTPATSGPQETATSTTQATSTETNSQSSLITDSVSATAVPSQPAESFSININTLSLSSQLVLGNLAIQATPAA